MGNLAVVMALLLGQIVKKIFLGELRDSEMEVPQPFCIRSQALSFGFALTVVFSI
jgi:hypothetical protein